MQVSIAASSVELSSGDPTWCNLSTTCRNNCTLSVGRTNGLKVHRRVLVTVTDFGSVWRWRFGKNPDDPRLSKAVYYNTTGVEYRGTCGSGRRSSATHGLTGVADLTRIIPPE